MNFKINLMQLIAHRTEYAQYQPSTHQCDIDRYRQTWTDLDRPQQTWTDMDRDGQRWTDMDRHGQTSTDLDRHGQTWTDIAVIVYNINKNRNMVAIEIKV